MVTRFSDDESRGLAQRAFTVNGGTAELSVGDLTIAVLSGPLADGRLQLIIKLPSGHQVFCRTSLGEIVASGK